MDTLIVEASRAGYKPKGRKEFKDEQLFARLIGAAVLLALAVIVLPFVLDGSGSQQEYEYADALPAEPARPVVEKSFSSRQPVTQLPSADAFEVRVPENTSLIGLTAKETTVTGSERDLTSVVANSQQPTQQVTAPAAQLNQGGLSLVAIQPGWNIQVASFVKDEAASKLIRRLQNQNLTAYANLLEGRKRSMIRVFVGPFANQIDALALQNRIDQDYRVESIIVRR